MLGPFLVPGPISFLRGRYLWSYVSFLGWAYPTPIRTPYPLPGYPPSEIPYPWDTLPPGTIPQGYIIPSLDTLCPWKGQGTRDTYPLKETWYQKYPTHSQEPERWVVCILLECFLVIIMLIGQHTNKHWIPGKSLLVNPRPKYNTPSRLYL